MIISVEIEKGKKVTKVDLSKGANVKDLLKKLKINITTVIVIRNNEVIVEDEKLRDQDKIKIISVISGG